MRAMTAMTPRALPLVLLSLSLAARSPAGPDDPAQRRPGVESPDAARPAARRPVAKPPGVGEPGGPERVLTPEEEERFLLGRALFQRDFHRQDGLGSPDMNADSCRACHRDPAMGGAGALELNVSRFARDHAGAGPFEELPGGQVLARLRPPWTAAREDYDPLVADVFEQRQTPALFGAGLIEGIAAEAILANEDPFDRDGDGIRGVARRFAFAGALEVGRFGWKAQVPRLEDFVRAALGSELGLTSPEDGRGFAHASDADDHADPEIGEVSVGYLAFFMANLAAPRRTGSLEPEVLHGELLFERIGCARCHVPELAGLRGPVPLYSDLLLHQVWPPDTRGMSEPGAGPGVYRTPPRWGARATAPYLHDGRASTLRAAIRLLDGEARAAREAFEALAESDRGALIAFLNDL